MVVPAGNCRAAPRRRIPSSAGQRVAVKLADAQGRIDRDGARIGFDRAGVGDGTQDTEVDVPRAARLLDGAGIMQGGLPGRRSGVGNLAQAAVAFEEIKCARFVVQCGGQRAVGAQLQIAVGRSG